GTGTAAAIGRPLAGKTGTTENSVDAWFIGYTPQLTTAVWMGYPSGDSKQMTSVRGVTVTGGSFPAQIFHNFMIQATKGMPVESFHNVASFSGRILNGSMVPFSTTTTSSATSPSTTAPATTSTTTAPSVGTVVATTPAGGATTTTTSAPRTTTTRPPPTTTSPTSTTRAPPGTTVPGG
ncbi:MAG: hypothetical protein ACYCZM_14100, partial [Acidimicrobiales bacterium]